MNPRIIRDALQPDRRYAKAIVGLAGIRTADTDGPEFEVTATWDGEQFTGGIWIAAKISIGWFVWAVHIPPRLFNLTLGRLVETFKELALMPSRVTMHVAISPQKKPHFKGFRFSDLVDMSLPPDGIVELEEQSRGYRPTMLETAIKEIRQAPKKLKGIGLV